MLRETLLLLLLACVWTAAVTNASLPKSPIASKESPIIKGAMICSLECNWYSIEINGAGVLKVSPDIATLSIQINANGNTTDAAVNALS
jgi:uncharacterized protein YggE